EATLFVSGAPRLTPTEYIDVSIADYEKKTTMRPVTASSQPTRRLVSSGIPSPYNEVVIVDPDTHIRLNDGQVGEVWVHGHSIAMGYWQNEQKTIETFHANIAGDSDKPFMRTGDLGFLHQQHLFICGRIKEVIIIRGANYYPQNIEQSLQGHIDGLKPSGGAAFTVEHQGEEQLVIVQEIERTWLKKIDKDQVIQQARHIISQEYGLSLYALVLIKPMSLPKTSSGKIQRAKSKIAFESDDLKTVAKFIRQANDNTNTDTQTGQMATAATASLDKEVADLLLMLTMVLANRAQLSMAQIDPMQPVTNTGLDSLALIELSATLKNISGVDLPLGTLLQSDSLIDIARGIQTARQQGEQTNAQTLQVTEAGQGATFDLSLNQLQMWLLYQKAPQSSAYNVPLCLIGQFNCEHLNQVLLSLLQIHPMLRTCIAHDDDAQKWQQVVVCLPENVVTEHHLSGVNLSGLEQQIIAASRAPFALDRGENCRFELFHCDDGQQRLLLNFHHIVVDMLSVQLFAQQLLGKLADSQMVIAQQGKSYREFIAWQSAFATSEAGQSASDFWQQKLSNSVPALQWPLPGARPKATGFVGRSFEFSSTEVCSK
ncbi:MAG: AMP-binding protein, partial [Algicola sp.]|nr:AMP-binding protein [Algicola sp.]